MPVIGRLAAALLLLWVVVVSHTSWRLTHPRRDWRPRNWQPSGLAMQAITIETEDGIRLRGWLSPRKGAVATAICVHGWGTNHTEMEWRAARLHSAGYSVLLFDFRACGESLGAMSSAGIRETQDLRAAVDLAASHPSFGGAPIVILADSMGAAVSIVVAAKDHRIRGVFSDAAYASLESATAWGFTTFTGLPPGPFKAGVRWAVETLTSARMQDLSVLAAVAEISPRPIVIAHGTDDQLISPNDSRALYARARQPKDLWLVPGAGHVVAEYLPTEVYDAHVIRLFEQALENRATSTAT